MTGGLRYDLLRKEISLDMYWYFVFSNKEERKLNVITCTNFSTIISFKGKSCSLFQRENIKNFFLLYTCNNAFLIRKLFVCIDYVRITEYNKSALIMCAYHQKQHVFLLYMYKLERSFSINLKREWKTSLSVYWSILKPSYGSSR